MRKLICIPTYNEVENIIPFINAILSLGMEFDVVVIDDSSPDGTGELVQELANSHKEVTLMDRTGKKRSFSQSYIDGFRYGLSHRYDYIGEMDADFSHDPNHLIAMNAVMEKGTVDFMVGSRYVKGGKIINWGRLRRFISWGGSFYARSILRIPIYDLTGGFNFWSRRCLDRININSIISDGYVFQIELKTKAYRKGMVFQEIPIFFEDRRVGKSKMSRQIIVEAIWQVLYLRCTR